MEEEAPEEGVEPGPEPAPEPKEEPEPVPPKKRPVKKVVPKKTVSKAEAPKKAPPQKGPAKKAPTKRKAPPPKPRKRPIPRMMLVLLVVALVVIASAASYFLVLKNEDPIALFAFDPSPPLVGEIVTFDARDSHDPDDGTIEKYVWDFGDGTSGKGRVVDHSYIEAESFRVRLTIEDDHGGRATTQLTVDVGALEISMERPYLSDLFQYDIEGFIELSNTVDGLFRFRGPTGAWEYIYAIMADISGEKTFEVTRTRLGKDGFMKGHDDARVEHTFYDLPKIRGRLETSMSVNPSFIGSVEATVEEDVCQHWERGIRSTVAVYADFSANVLSQDWASLSTVDEGTFYSQLTGIENTFSLNEFLRNTTFSSEDRETQSFPIGESTYLWQVKGMERVEERLVPSLHINVTMDRDTLQANDLDNFFIDVWLEPGLSQPAKYHVYVKGHEEGNRYKVDMTETLVSASMGSDEAWNLPCRADHSYTVKGEYPDDFKQLDRVPEQGGTTGGFQFTPEDAYQDALTDPQFLNYITDNPNAFFHLGNYTENGNVGRWVMAFGQKGNSEHNEVDARGTSSVDIDTDVDDYIDDKLPLDSPGSIGEVVTLSRGI
ncbi:MAG: PKD domain-containing protein, partial [Thermoplasmata archaeon]|nr:PKD domain-containing protein [Thermoplasmata archaeon]